MLSTSTGTSPPPRQRAGKSQSPRKVIRQEAFRQVRDPVLSNQFGENGPREGRTQIVSGTRNNRLREAHPPNIGMLDQDDNEDPHDLTFPAKRIDRASIVDNLVMSLDQFSPVNTISRDFDRSPSIPFPSHTLSRLDPSDNEVQPVSRPTTSVRVAKAEPAKNKKEVDIESMLEDETSQRAKAYGAQRSLHPPASRNKTSQHRPSTRSRSSSNSSSVDLGHLASFTGKLGPAGNRRSQSFDFGSSQRMRQMNNTESIETTPIPTGASDVEAQNVLNRPQTTIRRNSGRSIKGANRTKRRSGTVGAINVKPKPDSPQAFPPVKSSTYSSVDRKQHSEVQSGPPSTPRPGFFRRVFGSSKNVATPSNLGPTLGSSSARPSQDRSSSVTERPRPSSPTKLQKPTPAITIDPSSSKENQSVIAKKPSSFFRRRKKSMSTNVPPPLPLTLTSSLQAEETDKNAQSPVSSLRAFMGPYLAASEDNTAHQLTQHKRGTSLQSITNVDSEAIFQSSAQESNRNLVDDLKKAGASHKRKPSLQLSRLQIPSNSTFLVDSSSTEDLTKKPNEISPVSPAPAETDKDISDVSSIFAKDNGLSRKQQPDTSDTGTSRPRLQDRSISTQSFTKPAAQRRQTNQSINSTRGPQSATASEFSIYKSAPSTPTVQDMPVRLGAKSPHVHVSHPSMSQGPESSDIQSAQRIYDDPEETVNGNNACAWLGESGSERERVRVAYMQLFNWSGKTILLALRGLCSKLVLKGETQQVDRILDTFARRWCECNPNHGFRSADVVHTVCYSILLLNTDLHLADIGQKMTRAQFIRNAMLPIKQIALEAEGDLTVPPTLLSVRSNSYTSSSASLRPSTDGDVRSSSVMSGRPSDKLSREDSGDVDTLAGISGPLVEAPYTGSLSGWELQAEGVLKDFYTSISRDPLPLFGQPSKVLNQPSNNNLLGLSGLRRTPSTLSKARSETRGREGIESKSLGARWTSKGRSRPRLGSTQGLGSSRTSFDDGSSAWSPMSSTWSKTSLGKTLTSMSVDSFSTERSQSDYQSSIGFASALSQAIIRDEQTDMQLEEGIKVAPLLEDESLELHGAPWAKEGILKHKCHLEGVDKRSKDRNWNDCFAVIEKGWMRLFSFSTTAKSLRNKARNQKSGAGTVVGGGNWQDNAEEVWKFMLRHTIASSLPPPGYSKQRPYVWALSLPNGAVHLFSVGTPDIVKEFVSTANFWSARLSKEPMTGGVSSMEYGWSDGVINRALVDADSHSTFHPTSPRPSTQLSMRSSFDHGSNFRPRLPGDKVHIAEWNPPTQSLLPSQLMEVDQLKALQTYIKTIEDELQRHNELRPVMLVAFSSRHPNSNGSKAMANWEKKSSYLLREIVKFSTYTEALLAAQKTKKKIERMKREDEEARRDEKAERAFRRVNEDAE